MNDKNCSRFVGNSSDYTFKKTPDEKELNMDNDEKLQNAIMELLETVAFMSPEDRDSTGVGDELDKIANLKNVKTFHEAGVLTSDAGLVITLRTGEEYHLSIVRSR